MSILDLWQPILVSAVLVFLVSSIMHMVLPFHWNDYKKLPGEDAVCDAIREQSVPPGDYVFPRPASPKEMGSPETMERYKRGPVGLVTVLPNGPPAMGKSLLQWFLYTVVVSAAAGYVATITVPTGEDYMRVFRVTGTVAILIYALGHVPSSIWKGVSWSTSGKFAIDGVLYGLATAGAFGWLWPDG